MPRVSIICVSNDRINIEFINFILRDQSFQNYELICLTEKKILEALTSAILQAKGEILVFIDPSFRPVNKFWLEELVISCKDDHSIVKGLEVTSTPLDPSSLAGFREAFIDHPFDENYLWSEDTELFCRLKENGYRFVQVDCIPVIHPSKPGSKTYLRRSFRYGLYYSRIRQTYSDPVELTSATNTLKQIIASFLNLLGMIIGHLIYWKSLNTIRNPISKDQENRSNE